MDTTVDLTTFEVHSGLDKSLVFWGSSLSHTYWKISMPDTAFQLILMLLGCHSWRTVSPLCNAPATCIVTQVYLSITGIVLYTY